MVVTGDVVVVSLVSGVVVVVVADELNVVELVVSVPGSGVLVVD